jgi:hypothetical protein
LTKKSASNANFKYGLQKEKYALLEYEKLHNVKVQSIGFFVAPLQPWLGVSVDGVVINESGQITKLLEIKCPISCKNKPIVEERLKEANVKYLQVVGDELTLKKNHVSYTQCQLQMYCTGVTKCDFFV